MSNYKMDNITVKASPCSLKEERMHSITEWTIEHPDSCK